MSFSKDTLQEAWLRQSGRCAYCGKKLTWRNFEKGDNGAWHPHHRKAKKSGGGDSLGNCVLLCVNYPENCHLNVGHDGSFQENLILYDSDLPYLYYGDDYGL